MGKTILLDIDSTLNNFQEHFMNEVKRRYPEILDKLPNDAVHFDLLKLDKPKAMSILQDEGFTGKMIPLPGAVAAVHKLAQLGYSIFFCTTLVTDNSDAMKDRVHWIGDHFGKEWMEKVIFTKDKTMVRGDFLIDDSPFKTKGSTEPLWKLIVFDVKYNKNDPCYGRIYNWTDFEKLLEILERQE